MFDSCMDDMCPQCSIEDKSIQMLLNDADFYECPICNLQVSFREWPIATVLNFRGKGKFRQGNKTIPNSKFGTGLVAMNPKSEHLLSGGGLFTKEKELRKYVSEIK